MKCRGDQRRVRSFVKFMGREGRLEQRDYVCSCKEEIFVRTNTESFYK